MQFRFGMPVPIFRVNNLNAFHLMYRGVYKNGSLTAVIVSKIAASQAIKTHVDESIILADTS